MRIALDAPRGLQVFQPSTKPVQEDGKSYKATEEAMQAGYNSQVAAETSKQKVEIRRNIIDSKGKDLAAITANKQQANGNDEDKDANGTTGAIPKQVEDIAKESKKPTFCNSCAIECTRIRYHYAATESLTPEAKYISTDICPNCFVDGRYDASAEASKFVKLEDENFTSVPEKDAPWTDAELLLLLEGLEHFDEDWNEIADHVRTRTREECVIKFLQLEIEDQYLESDQNGPNYPGLESGRFPFSQSENPVLSVLGYLVGLSEPSVAAAAGGRAIEEQTKRMRKRLDRGIGGAEATTTSNDKDAMKGEDTMDLDTAASPRPGRDNDVATIENSDLSRDSMKDVANTVFAATAARAAALASNEEREMTRLVSAAVNTSLQKMELKMRHFTEMEAGLEAERRDLEKGRQQLFLDRLAFRKRVENSQEMLAKMKLSGEGTSAKETEDVTLSGPEGLEFQNQQSVDGIADLPPITQGAITHEI